MPTLAAPLDCAKLETRNERVHNLSAAPSSPVSGQLYFNTTDHTLYWYDDNLAAFVSARSGTGGPPSGTAGGDLAGTYPNPDIKANVIVIGDINSTLIDQAAGSASLRTLAFTSITAMPGNARLDQIAVPTASVSMNSRNITNLLDPVSAQDAATKNYVDTFAQGLDSHPSVKAATTANITLSAPQTVDGVSLIAGDRCLVKDQSTPANNGIYVVAAGAWTRALDQDTWLEVPSAYVFVEQGTVNADSGWTCTADAGGTLGSTSMPWTQFSGAGAITAGAGLTKTGSTLDIGAGAGITVNADSIQISNNGVTNAMLADGAVNLNSLDVTGTLQIANGGTQATTATTARLALGVPAYYSALGPASPSTSYLIPQTTHGMYGNRAIMVQCLVESTGLVVIPDVTIAASGDVNLSFGASQSANTIRVILIGIQSGGSPTQPV